MVDLSKKPFYLSAEDIAWVEQTVADMTLDEKVWQLFADPLMGRDEENLVAFLKDHPLGACPFRAGQFDNATARKVLAAAQDSGHEVLLQLQQMKTLQYLTSRACWRIEMVRLPMHRCFWC